MSAPLVKQLLCIKHKSTPTLRWGQQHEQDAREMYKNTYLRSTVTKSVLVNVIDKIRGWLACSSGDLVTDPSARDALEWWSTNSPKETNNMD